MMKRRSILTVAVCLALTGTLAACGGSSASRGTGGVGPVGLDLPRADSDFWNSYARYVPQKAKDLGVNLMPQTNSQNDVAKLVANVQALTSQGAKAVVMAPQDTGAIATTLQQLQNRKIPVVTVDTRPDRGKAYMVVRADNRAYGDKACHFLGDQLHGQGKVIEFQGALSSINGRDRSEAFAFCMKQNYPGITVFEEPTDWEASKAASALQTRLTQHPDIQGIYLQAGGVFLAPTLQVLRSTNHLFPAGDPNHVTIVSNDGIPQEYQEIRKGDIDATVSQPADLYAQWALYYAKAALQGTTFQPGPTDHNSTIVDVGDGLLEDQLPAPLVTKSNVDDPTLWGNQIGH
jgi:simple sugar transport system substrate-binding protein/ribose transport system substrate-binding protein